jgi:hypothetical protein
MKLTKIKSNPTSKNFGASMNDEDTPANDQRHDFQPKRAQTGNLKVKMLMLFGMLLMVMYAMHEAGKPKNWEWMNFPKQASALPTSENRKPNAAHASSEIAAAPASKTNRVTNKPNSDSTHSKSAIKPIRLFDASPETTAYQNRHQVPIESSKFWQQLFASLNTEQQLELFQLLDRLQDPSRLKKASKLTGQQIQLLKSIKKQRAAFDDQLLDRMTSLPESSKEKSRSSEDYFEADKFWTKNLLVALEALIDNSDITLGQQNHVQQLQLLFESEALKLVQDNTAIGWTGDTIAWKRNWKRIHEGNVDAPATITRIQLVAQPDEYRGKSISVQGYVRAIESRRAEAGSSVLSSADAGKYFIVWVKPIESQSGPYCIYSNELPQDLPTKNDLLANFNSIATIEGLFFKNRSYPAASGEVLSCPLILANNFKLTAPKIADAPTLFWQPGRSATLALIWLIPLIAIGGAWLVFRASRTQKRLPSEKAQQKIGLFLGDLKDDPNVQTDLEKVQAIREREIEIE